VQENDPTVHDIAIVGGGVVGCALLRRFALAGARTVLLERAPDILSGASKGNSAILHTGFDAPPESLELACMRAGYAEYLEVKERLNLPLLETSALLVAWNDAELAKLPQIVAQAHANGVGDVRSIDVGELYRREPNLAQGARGAVLVPGEHVIDPWSAPLAYALQGLANGGQIRRNAQVTGGAFDGRQWTLDTGRGPVQARAVINAAGLQGDLVEAIARPSPFSMRPRKGQFVVFDKPAARLVNAIILPVPTDRTKGVLIARTAFGNLLVGPTAEDQEDRETATCDQETLAELIATGGRLLPALAGHTVTATYAGLRPATEVKDYRIEALPERRWITVGGIRSTGLTAALGIAQHVASLYAAQFDALAAPAEPIWTPVPNLAEHLPRPYQKGAGEIVCHCELVTRAEIEAALAGPLPAGDIGGLKRRTRCMMGRCQGFYCSWRVTELAAARLPDLPTVRRAS
jgi:glycerol-3-phosphate dehydrogenase